LANAMNALKTLPQSDARSELGTIAEFLVSRTF